MENEIFSTLLLTVLRRYSILMMGNMKGCEIPVLTPRKLAIFKAIVEEFIQTAEPVGSKTLMEKYSIEYSSATIRNEMGELEDLGLLEKTHTSSGRIPSSKGYRFYVEHLMSDGIDTQFETALTQVFSDRQRNIDDVIRLSCDILSQMTQLTSVVLGPEASDQNLKEIRLVQLNPQSAMAIFITDGGHIEHRIFNFGNDISVDELASFTNVLNERLVDTPLSELVTKMESIRPILAAQMNHYEQLFESFVNAFVKFANENVYTSGEMNMMYQPEFSNVEKLKQISKILEDSSMWREVSKGKGDLNLKKSDHSELVWIDDLAIVSSSVRISDDDHRKLMVVGPTRMDYDRIVSMIEYITKMIENVYGKDGNHGEKE